MTEPTIYLDYNATTPVLVEVMDAMLPSHAVANRRPSLVTRCARCVTITAFGGGGIGIE